MPLFKGKSKQAFSKNVATEMDAGKPQKQSLAIAYAMKRRGEQKMAEGGMITDNYQSHCTEHCEQPCMVHEQASGFENDPPEQHFSEGGTVDRIMRKRYSEGGMVANGGEDKLDELADGRPNEFDDLALDDHLTSTNSGAADGDYLDDAQEDEDRADTVSRIMASRRKKDRMPRPA